jgi:hypothetical protein
MSADLALQKALHARLAGDAALAALVGARIYDNPPDDAGFPYLTLGENARRDWSTGESRGAEHFLSLHAFSRRGGRSEAKAVLAAVAGALDEAALTLEGHALINLQWQDSETRREADGRSWRGTIRFRAVTEET